MADLKTTVERRDRFRTWLHDDTRDHLSIRAWCVAEDACDDVDTLLAENAALLPGDGDVVHIVDGAAYPAEALVWRALCGAACVAWDDGSLVPEGFDFYALGYGHDAATCAPCRAAARQP